MSPRVGRVLAPRTLSSTKTIYTTVIGIRVGRGSPRLGPLVSGCVSFVIGGRCHLTSKAFTHAHPRRGAL